MQLLRKLGGLVKMTVTVDNLTSNVVTDSEYIVTGDGVLDTLMSTINTHLDAQYKLGRLTGTDYATVYLGATQAALQQAVTYVLGQETTNAQVLHTAAQTKLVEQQVLASIADTALTDQKVLQSAAQINLIENQALTESEKIGLMAQQILKSVADTALTEQQELTEIMQTAVVQNTIAAVASNAAAVTANALTATNKGIAEVVLLGGQELKVQREILRIAAELTLLEQKEITEYAQTQQTVTNTPPHANSILGRQATLTQEQTKAFKWNANQKYLKTLFDGWSINTSTAGVPATGITAINATGTDNLNTQITNAKPTG